MPFVVLLGSMLLIAGPYFTGSTQLYPEHVEAYHNIPTGFAQMSIVFNKTGLTSDQYDLGFVIKFFVNDSRPSFTWAHCVSPNECGTIYNLPRISADPGSIEEFEGSFWTAHYSVWTASTRYSWPSLATFTPFLFPLDAYSTDLYYISVSDKLPISYVGLRASVPVPFAAVLTDFRTIAGQDLPQQLRTYDNFAAGSIVAFRISMLRSPNNLFLSVAYSMLPFVSIYEVAVLSSLAIAEVKDRLMVFVGALFSVFAYFLAMRQLAPPNPTLIEGLAGIGMVAWILMEATRFLRSES